MGLKFPKLIVTGSAIGATIGGIVIMKEFFGGRKLPGNVRADGKIVIITGANTGIGKTTAHELAAHGAKVYMACRDMEKCEVARKAIVLSTKNKFVYCRYCDLASQESIRQFAQSFLKEQNRLDVLINNAGIMRCPRMVTKEGIEMQLGVNHMGHFLLTNLLLGVLERTAPSRIVIVSSIAHTRGNINFEDLNSEKDYDPGRAYSQSKLANLLHTKELARRLIGTGVTVNAVHPGIVNTELARHMGFYNSIFASLFFKPLMWVLIKTPRQGAQASVLVALDESFEGVSGKYFSNVGEQTPADQANDDAASKRLWAISDRWTHVKIPLAKTQSKPISEVTNSKADLVTATQ